jgi:hypothetical protein
LSPQHPPQRWHETTRYGFYFMSGYLPVAAQQVGLESTLRRRRCSRLERFYLGEKFIFILKTRFAISFVLNFHNASVVTRDRRIGCYDG